MKRESSFPPKKKIPIEGKKPHECLFLAAGRTCSSQQFTCSNGQCIPSAYRCDRVKDCTDGTDERDCRESLVLALYLVSSHLPLAF